jgi:DivIVA domain-containing protein
MPLTPEDVSNKRFTPVRLREGYDMGEVDQFLDEVASPRRTTISARSWLLPSPAPLPRSTRRHS